MPNFPSDWYWIVGGDETRAFSSSAAAYVASTDAAYVAFNAGGAFPTRILDEVELAEVLTTYGLGLGPLPAPVPEVISRMQAQLELHATASPTNAGKTALDDVTAAVEAATDPKLAIYWNTATDFHRDHPKLTAMATALNWSSAFVDQLFINADQLS